MSRNKKMSTIIAAGAIIVSILCISILYLASSSKSSSIMEKSAIDNMMTALNLRSGVVTEFVENAELLLRQYASAEEVTQVLKNPDNAQIVSSSQEYTDRFYSNLNQWEAVYTSRWADTYVYTHSNHSAIGITFRAPDAMPAYQASMVEGDRGMCNAGATVSPASGQMILSLRMAVYDTDGKTPIGFVGGGPFVSQLGETLDAYKISGLESAQYTVIDAVNGSYIFHPDTELLAQPVEDPVYLNVMEAVANGKEEGNVSFKGQDGKGHILVYKSMPDYGWILTTDNLESEIYAESRAMQRSQLAICVIICIVITAFLYLVGRQITKPLQKVEIAIDDLSNLNLKQNEEIQQYVGGKSEIGKIATAADSVTKSMSDILSTLGDCVLSLKDGSETMADTSTSLVDCATDNMATSEELSASISNTNEAIDNMNSELHQINELVNEVDEKVAEGTNQSDAMISFANDMTAMANKTLTMTERKLDSTKTDVQAAMDELQALSKINEMAEQILDITSQTNLLSLNASIEAARAGEAGRGFAVVASEIGKLAENSSETVSQIQEICNSTNESIERIRGCFADIINFMESDMYQYFKKMAEMSTDYSSNADILKQAICGIRDASQSVLQSVDNIQEQTENIQLASGDNEEGIKSIIEKADVTNSLVETIDKLITNNQSNIDMIYEIISKFQKE